MKDTIYKYNAPLNIALLADLHDRPFEWITRSLQTHKPDIICIVGDVVHRTDLSKQGLVIHQTEYVLPFLKAVSPARFLVRMSRAVANSSPMNPSLRSHVLIAYLGFSFCCGLGLALFSVFAVWLSARQSWM